MASLEIVLLWTVERVILPLVWLIISVNILRKAFTTVRTCWNWVSHGGGLVQEIGRALKSLRLKCQKKVHGHPFEWLLVMGCEIIWKGDVKKIRIVLLWKG